MSKMLDTATTFSVYLVKGRALALPSVAEYRKRNGLAAPRLRVRAPFLFGHATFDRASGWADGWNQAHATR